MGGKNKKYIEYKREGHFMEGLLKIFVANVIVKKLLNQYSKKNWIFGGKGQRDEKLSCPERGFYVRIPSTQRLTLMKKILLKIMLSIDFEQNVFH